MAEEATSDLAPPLDPDELQRRKHSIAFDAPPADREFAWPTPIGEVDVRDALAREVKRHSCWRSAAVSRLNILSIDCFTSLHYTLETFTESRSTVEATEACSVSQFMEQGGVLSGLGGVLEPWDVPCMPSQDFIEETRLIELPGTTHLNACQSCSAEGVTHCFHCRGFGTAKCDYCRGTGMKSGIPHPAVYTHPMVGTMPHTDSTRGYPGSSLAVIRPPGGGLTYGKGTPIHFMSVSGVPPPGVGHHDICFFCRGRGVKECAQCKGQGKRQCAVCGSSGAVRAFTKVRIRFAVERSDFFHNDGDVPEQLLRGVSGHVVLAESQPYVLPLRHYPVEAVNENSKRMCQMHLSRCLGACKILKQRQILEAVPLARVAFEFGRKGGVFWVYGQERQCYVPNGNYPSKCSIL